jgi:hypothetical protein
MRGAVSGSVVSISNFPSSQVISGSVTANLTQIAFTNTQGGIASDDGGTEPNLGIQLGYYDGDYKTVKPSQPLPISGTVTANVFGTGYNNVAYSLPVGLGGTDAVTRGIGIGFHENLTADEFRIVRASEPFPVQVRAGTVTIGSALPAGTNRIGVVTIGAGTVTIGAGTAQIGSVTASISNFPATQAVSLTTLPALVAGTAQIGSVTASISGTVPISISSVTVGNSVTIGSLPALAAGTAQIGSVTASISANPSGALTTRFGSVTTANTAQITTAVTNTSRKYLFTQNISTGIVTIGIGFSPTTTQGIQLSAGSGIVFDSFCPTGAVYWLGATTGAAWSILEG